MIYTVLVTSLFACGTGAWIAFFALALTLHLLLTTLIPDLIPGAALICLSTVFVVPLAALLIGRMLDRLLPGRAGVFGLVALPITVAIWFSTDAFFNFFSASLQSVQLDSISLQCAYFAALFGAALFVAAAVGVMVWLTVVLFELLCAWLSALMGMRYPVEVFSLRPLIIILVLSFSINLIPGLLVRNLWPTTILKSLVP